jgi:cytochrome oxidase assembly protein ShyY1
MYWFLLRPKWIGFTLGIVLLIVVMINLGFWQLRRLDQRRETNAAVEARYDLAPQPLDSVLTPGTDPDDVQWRPVIAVGTYRPDGTVHIVNRSQNGFAGDNIVVPLDLGDGRVLLVNRGFLPLGEDVPPPPSGEVAVTGRLRPSQTRHFAQLSDPSTGTLTEAQRLDIARLQQQVDGELVDMYVDAVTSSPADSPALEPVIKPDLSEGPHLSYAVQWFIFSVCAAVGWVLAIRHSAAKRRRDAERAAEPPPVEAAV